MAESQVFPTREVFEQALSRSRCPSLGCGAEMHRHPLLCLEGTGLESLRCPACAHHGFRSQHGIRVLSAGRHDHVCSYGASGLSFKVLFSESALILFGERGLCPSQAASYAAQWALLSGQVAGMLHMFLESPALARCYDYVLRYHLGQL
jgi:hypothetical protein